MNLFSGHELAGEDALVTGAGSGIGRSVAVALSTLGMHLLLVGRHMDRLHTVARGIQDQGGGATPVSADLGTEAGRASVVAAVGPRLRVLVHCAGAYLSEPVGPGSALEWAALDSVNLHAPVLLTLACRPSLRAASGNVVFVNSTAGLRAGASLAYSAGKHGLRAAADSLRQDLNVDGGRVTSVFPGRTDTPMQQSILSQEGRVVPPGVLLTPHDVAQVIVSALVLPISAEVTEITIRPSKPV
jgi:NAD(P)-dependent dehydrogenase (short-subunit alcohol dehydrogenase family)